MSEWTCDRRTTKWQAQRSAVPSLCSPVCMICFVFRSFINAAASIYETASSAKTDILQVGRDLTSEFCSHRLDNFQTLFRLRLAQVQGRQKPDDLRPGGNGQ